MVNPLPLKKICTRMSWTFLHVGSVHRCPPWLSHQKGPVFCAEGFRLKYQEAWVLEVLLKGVVGFFDVFPFRYHSTKYPLGIWARFAIYFCNFFSGAYSFIGLLQGKWHPCSSLWLNVLWSLSRLSVEASENPLVYTLEQLSN